MEEYPNFWINEDGQIESDMPDIFGITDDGSAELLENDKLSESDMVNDGSDHVSESILDDQDPADQLPEEDAAQQDEKGETILEDNQNNYNGDLSVSAPLLVDIQEDIARIVQAQASTEGYLSTSALDVFDRVVEGYNYSYYCAFRYDNDSYNAIMYMADKISSSGSSVVLQDAVSVRLYRVYNSSTRVYTYHYLKSDAGDVSVSLADGLMYYTNCDAGYPTLGSVSAPSKYPSWAVLLCGVIFFALLIISFRRK